MEFPNPEVNIITIYGKSGCKNCIKVKNYLIENNVAFKYIDYDDYLVEEKKALLFFLCEKAKKQIAVFPCVFSNGNFIGGFQEIVVFIKKINELDDCF